MLAQWWEDPTLIYWILAGISLYLLGVPLLVFSSQKMAASPACEELEMHSLDPALAQFIMEKTQALFDLGFDEPTLLHLPNPTPGVKAYLVLVVNRTQGDHAMVTALVGEAGMMIQTWYVEFSTRHENNQCVNTLNSAELSAFPTSPQNIRTQVPSVTDVAELYKLHQFRKRTNGITARKVLYEPGQAIPYLKQYAFKKSYDEQVARGWLFYEAGEDCYRPTLKGAYLMTWPLIQPMKMFAMQAMQRKEKEVLAAFRNG